MRVLYFTAPAGAIPCEYPDTHLPLQKLEGLFYQMLTTAR